MRISNKRSLHTLIAPLIGVALVVACAAPSIVSKKDSSWKGPVHKLLIVVNTPNIDKYGQALSKEESSDTTFSFKLSRSLRQLLWKEVQPEHFACKTYIPSKLELNIRDRIREVVSEFKPDIVLSIEEQNVTFSESDFLFTKLRQLRSFDLGIVAMVPSLNFREVWKAVLNYPHGFAIVDDIAKLIVTQMEQDGIVARSPAPSN